MAQAFGFRQNSRPIYISRLKHRQLARENLGGQGSAWQLIFNDVIEAPEQRTIQHIRVVGGRYNSAERGVFFEQLQKEFRTRRISPTSFD